MEIIDFIANFRKYLHNKITTSSENNLSSTDLEHNRAIKFVDGILQEFYEENK